MKPILNVRQLHVAYGHVHALKGVNLKLHAGDITALVGANGAGKSTSLLAISGLIKAGSGSIEFNGEDLRKLAPHHIVQKGLVQVAEGRAILGTLTVQENLDLGAYTRKDKENIAKDLDWVFSLFPVLKNRASGLAGNLSGGEQQMLAIGRALMARPTILLLDEPSMGLSPIMVEKIFEVVRNVSAQGVTILLVEQNAKLALQAAHRGYVMDSGLITMSGNAKDMLDDPKVQAAYLGEA